MNGESIQRVRLGGVLELGDQAHGQEPSGVLIALLIVACALWAHTVISDWRQRRGR